ncbi:MAG TPA: hypothetical protein VHG92_03780 [Afifellaceae bacterium]|nr:hypothetical protein [Afifellaceae bacterium]
MDVLWEVSLPEFLLVTVFLAGGAAWITGRAMALTWGSWWQLGIYIALLAVAARFIHFSLFSGSFFLPLATFYTALYYYIVDLAILVALAALGRQTTRARQMSSQYGFLYERAGPIGWRRRG